MSLASSIRRVHRHRELMAAPEVWGDVLAYVAARRVAVDGHLVWTGPRQDGTPKGMVGHKRMVDWDDGRMTRGVRFDPRLVTWSAAGLPFDDAVAILPVCGVALCVALQHLAAVPWTAMGPDE